MNLLNEEMERVHWQIFFFMDNVPLHITNDQIFSNIKIYDLLTNITLKIYLIDARIIMALKQYYWCFHLQNALDRDKQNELNLYKVHQLTIIYWALKAQIELSPTIIQNFFKHVRLFEQASKVVEIDNSEETIKEELVGIIQGLPIRNPMSIKNMLNPIEENSTHIELDDHKIVELVCHQQAEGDKGVDNILNEDLAEVLFMCMENLQSLFVVISMLDIRDVGEYAIHKFLCNIQQKLHIKDLQQSMLKVKLDSWLGQILCCFFPFPK